MKITDFINPQKKEVIEKKLKRLKSASSKEERRELEEKLFVPDEIPTYTGERPIKSDVDDKTVTLVFQSKSEVELLAKYMKISWYKGANVRSRNLTLLTDFLEALDRGELIYDKEKRTFRHSERVNEVRSRKRRIRTL